MFLSYIDEEGLLNLKSYTLQTQTPLEHTFPFHAHPDSPTFEVALSCVELLRRVYLSALSFLRPFLNTKI